MKVITRKQRKLTSDVELNRFIDVVVLPECKELTIKEICDRFDIDDLTLYSKLRNREIRQGIKDRLEMIAVIETPAVYRALIKRAKDGHTPAIELFLARFEGFRKMDANQVNVTINPEQEKENRQRVMDYLKNNGMLVDAEEEKRVVNE